MSNTRLRQQPDNLLLKEIYLISGSLRTGGIETMLLRMANFFVSKGISVSVCCQPGGKLEPLLDKEVEVIHYLETSDLTYAIQTEQRKKKSESEILIISFDPISAARALMVETKLSQYQSVSHVSGVFHPRAYFMTGERIDRIYLNYLLARAIGKWRFFFMNKECRNSHAERWNTNLTCCPILPLPINKVEAVWQPSDKPSVRIVSVGRLVDFKSYNLGAARVVKACLNRGVQVTWDIYGDGPLKTLILKEIEDNGINSHIRLMGVLDYSAFSSKVVRYDLFVGMGTAALEAAMLGVPTICATVDKTTQCYGYLNNLPFGNVGEQLANPPTLELADLIQNYSEYGMEQRSFISRQCRIASEEYGMPKFAEALTNVAIQNQIKPHWLFKRLVAEFYRFATESKITKVARQFIGKNSVSL